ncbi:MAG: glycerol-3-phosphate acyltransferase [Candidatus Hodarchaeota archaeon]
MNAIEILIGLLSILIGYLLGTINPGYFFGRLKGIDIREEGTGNAGTSNVRIVLGIKYAMLTAFYDTFKGIIAIFIALAIGANFVFAQVSGYAAIIGHILPFYMQFRGGQGIATATGIMLLYFFTQYFITIEFFFVFCYSAAIYVIFYSASRVKKSMPMIFVMPIYGYAIYLHYPNNPYNIFCWIILFFLLLFGIYSVIRLKIFNIEDEGFKSHWWRVAIRPVSLLFLLFYFVFSETVGLILIGIVSLCFIGLDLSRFLSHQTQELLTVKIKAIFRKGEEGKFSSMTIFLISTFISLLVFKPIYIAITAIVFLVFGDIFSKIFGLAYGRHKLFDKSIEGTLAYLGTVLICGYFIYNLIDIPLVILIAGGIAATITEFLPLGMNDNFTVPIISGAVMSSLILFGL